MSRMRSWRARATRFLPSRDVSNWRPVRDLADAIEIQGAQHSNGFKIKSAPATNSNAPVNGIQFHATNAAANDFRLLTFQPGIGFVPQKPDIGRPTPFPNSFIYGLITALQRGTIAGPKWPILTSSLRS